MAIIRIALLMPLFITPFATQSVAQAEIELFQACFAAKNSANEPAGDCVNEAQAVCLSFDPGSQAAAGTLCFVKAKEDWAAGITAQMDQITAMADPQIAAVAGIEVKYDLLSNLLQCERMRDLALLTDRPSDAIVLQFARCEATATGLVLTKLMLQSRGLLE